MGTVRRHIFVDCDADTVWKFVGSPERLHEWFPITSCRVEGKKRWITLASGITFEEDIVTLDHDLRRFQYKIVNNPLITFQLGHERLLTEWDGVLFGKIVHLRTICRDNWVCTAAMAGTMNNQGEGELYDLSSDPLQHVNRWADPSVRTIRDDLLTDLWDNLPAQNLPLRTMDAPV